MGISKRVGMLGSAVLVLAAWSVVEASATQAQVREIRTSRADSAQNRRQRQCWDAYSPEESSFLDVSAVNETSKYEQVRSMCSASRQYETESGKDILTSDQRRSCEAILSAQTPDLLSGYDSNLYGPLWNAFPKMAGALFGRSVFSGCKCEACVYSLDTLIMYLDEDTLGFFNEGDINRVLMDRFCYGLKWMYRSACHHIMSMYYPQVVDMLQKYLTGWDVCRHLRFCPWSLTSNDNVQP
eukprot:c52289_g1_i1.p1 GENE.c52289_g1_i1~~c52289_g1_i1.p1  ORF type:complete len:240 (-),score=25.64 c52289_g1_i1:35-754(-)